MKKALLILADGFEEIEALGTVDILRRLGVEVVTASVSGESVTGAHNIQLKADSILEKVVTDHFDAVILPGGMPGAANLDADANVSTVLQLASRRGAVIAAICAAPFVLAKRGLLNGKIFTMYPGFEAELGTLSYTANLSERDGNIVTGKGPGAAFAFAACVAAKLGADAQPMYKDGMFIQG